MLRVYLGGEELVLRPDPSMAPGGEGAVFPDPSDPGFVIKVVHSPNDDWRAKLRVMLADPLAAPDVAWPTEPVLSSDRTTIVGYRMPCAANKHPIPDVYTTNPQTRWLIADYGFRLDVAINLAAAVKRVHDHRCVVGDLSPKNILVGKDASLCLIDADSFQVSRNGQIYRCKVGTPDHTPPEILLRGNFGDVDLTEYSDAFGLAVFIFELLVGPGNHPFAAGYLGTGTKATLVERIRLGIWPYARKGHPDYAPRTGAPLDLLHPLVQPLMFRCFEAGHSRPTERPLPADWLVVLNDLKQDTDFVTVAAPRLEADAQARQRQAILAAIAPQTPRPVAPGLFAKTRTRLRQSWSRHRKLVLSLAASLLVLAVGAGVYVATPRGPRIPFAQKGRQPLPTPLLYRSLSGQEQIPPSRTATKAGSLPTPALYDSIAAKHR